MTSDRVSVLNLRQLPKSIDVIPLLWRLGPVSLFHQRSFEYLGPLCMELYFLENVVTKCAGEDE